jgi:hypothetical protein
MLLCHSNTLPSRRSRGKTAEKSAKVAVCDRKCVLLRQTKESKEKLKMKKTILLAAMLCLCAAVSHAQDPNFYIYLCIGQSNMVGQGPIAAEDSIVSDRFLNLTASDCDTHPMGQWRKAIPPLCRQWTKLCPADYFGRTMVENLPENVRVGTIMVAVDGCSIRLFHPDSCSQWIAGDLPDWQRAEVNCYGGLPLHRLLTLAEKAQNDGVIKGILLHQGETDAYNDQWRKTLRKIYRDLQQELRFDSTAVPLLVGEVVRGEYGGVCGHANPTINDIARHYPNTYVVSSEGCLPSADNLHFSSEGYRQLGRHYALRYLEATDSKLAELCRQRLSSAGYDNISAPASSLTVKTSRRGKTLGVEASEPIEKVDVVSYSGQTVKIFTPGGKKAFELKLKGLPKEKLVFVFQGAGGKATADIDLQ